MARWWDQNRAVIADHASAFLYSFKELAKTAGWTVLQASDGANYVNDGSDPITSVAEMTADNAWILLQMPDGNRKMMIVHNSTDHQKWYIGYAKSGTYNNGDATTPAAMNTAEEKPVHGQFTAPNTRTPLDFAPAVNYYMQLMFNDAAPYEFYGILAVQGTGVVNTIISGEEVLDPTTGDPDPFVISARRHVTGGCLTLPNMTLCPAVPPTVFGNDDGCNGWLDDEWSSFGYGCWSDSDGAQFPPYTGGHGAGVNPWDATDDAVRAVIARPNYYGSPSYKGMSNLFRYGGVIRSPGDLVSVDSAGDWIAYEHTLIPWNNTVASI